MAAMLLSSMALYSCTASVSNEVAVTPMVQWTHSDRLPGYRVDVALDADRDGRDDVMFEYGEMAATDDREFQKIAYLDVRPLSGNAVHQDACGTCPLSRGWVVDHSLGWTGLPVRLATIAWSEERGWQRFWSGKWPGTGEGIMGLRLTGGGDDRFGWLSMECSRETGELTIFDFSVKKEPSVGIMAGEYTQDI
jgi:hypothetical protein